MDEQYEFVVRFSAKHPDVAEQVRSIVSKAMRDVFTRLNTNAYDVVCGPVTIKNPQLTLGGRHE